MRNHKSLDRIKKILTALFFTLLIPLIAIIGCTGLLLFTCNRSNIHDRAQIVDADPLLKVNISSEADVLPLEVIMDPWASSNDMYWENMRAPIGLHGANVFVKRASSLTQARREFIYICENGWVFGGDRNKRTRNRLVYGGKQDNQFCASPIVEGRGDMTSLCAPIGNYESYVIFQKGDVLIAIYESEGNDLSLAGNSTNKAIQNLSMDILAE